MSSTFFLQSFQNFVHDSGIAQCTSLSYNVAEYSAYSKYYYQNVNCTTKSIKTTQLKKQTSIIIHKTKIA